MRVYNNRPTIYHQIVWTTQHRPTSVGRVPKKPKVRLDRQRYPDDQGFTTAFTVAELDDGITALKNGTAPGLGDIQTELIKHMGPKARKTAPGAR